MNAQVGANIVQLPIEPEPPPPLEPPTIYHLLSPLVNIHITHTYIHKVDISLATIEEKQWIDDAQHHAV